MSRRFRASARPSLQSYPNLAAGGNPEDQLRAPFERLLQDMAALSARNNVVLIGESSLEDLSLRPDYAVAVDHALAGFVELKAPGKGADPRRFTNPRDKEQGEKLRSLPNVLFTDGNTFSLWQEGNSSTRYLRFTATSKLLVPNYLQPRACKASSKPS